MLFVTVTLLALSCTRGDTVCQCSTYAPVARNHFLLGKGKRISWDKATEECQKIQKNTIWDTCIVVEMR